MAFDIALVIAALTCSLVTGLLLGFVIVAMPGLGTLDDRGFTRGFQVMDRVIQDGHPVFMLVWAGSVVAVLAAAVLGLGEVTGAARALLLGSAALWLVGVQLPTAAINIPMNNRIQQLDVAAASDEDVRAEREAFEGRWNRWNATRTLLGTLASLGLLLTLLTR